MDDPIIPDLTLRGVLLGPKQAPIDLRILLYRGAATTHYRIVRREIESGRLGMPQLERLPFLELIHRHWQSAVSAKTRSASTLYGHWSHLRAFVAFTDASALELTLANVLSMYLAYCEQVKNRADLKSTSRYAYSFTLAQIVAPAIGLDAGKLQWKTKIRAPRRLGNQGAKENLEGTATFIQTLLETIDQLSVDVIQGSLPVTLCLRKHEYKIYCGRAHQPIDNLKIAGDSAKLKRALRARERRAGDISNLARSQLVNLRIDAEFLIFVNQTGCNLTQALQLTGSKFRYRSAGDYYHLIAWKNRAKHNIELRIYKGYRAHLEAYLKWRAALFPNDPDGLTFPFVWNDGDKSMHRTHWAFSECRKLMTTIGQPFVPTTQLRKTVGNFVKRNLSRQAAAELLSNSVRTFRESYEEVHHQTAAAELVDFWNGAQSWVSAVGPGGCHDAAPQKRSDSPAGAPMPDCETAGACLFCDKNRDFRNFDHVWNLASLRQLKLAELNADRAALASKEAHPAEFFIERINAKLDALLALKGMYEEWVEEAQLRVKEGRYHPFYSATFELLEGCQ